MSELRELKQGMEDGTVSLYDMVVALVEAMEPEDIPTDEQYNDARDDRIRFLQDELAKAKAETERLRERHLGHVRELVDKNIMLRAKLRDALRTLGTELAQAKVKLERLRKERDSAELKLETLKAIDKRILADAALGRLVRRLPRGSHLSHSGLLDGWVYVDFATMRQADTPIEALRSIQTSEEEERE